MIQIFVIKEVLREIKDEFNKEFDNMTKERDKQIDLINENLKKAYEVYNELEETPVEINIRKNILSDPKKLFILSKSEFNEERYLSKEIRNKMEKQRLEEEQKLLLLNANDNNLRA